MRFLIEFLDRWRTRGRSPWSDLLLRLRALQDDDTSA